MDNVPPEISLCISAASDKKAEDLVLLDLRGLSDATDYFIVCHGSSDRQVKAIVDNIQDELRKAGFRPSHVEGDRNYEWVLIDFIDVVVHVFQGEKREFYRIESLWGAARRIELPSDPSSGPSAESAPSG